MKTRLLTSQPRTFEAATAMRDRLLSVQAPGVPLRLWPVVIASEQDERYHVAELGWAEANGFEPIR